jgi:GT2 family glycosyltransferase
VASRSEKSEEISIESPRIVFLLLLSLLDSATVMVSVLLPFRNAGRTIEEAISSILADMTSTDELVLVNDGSTDDSEAIARASVAAVAVPVAVAKTMPIITVVNTGGVGIAQALTLGLAQCRGQWIARMDADDISLRGRLAAQRMALESDERLGAVATKIEAFGDPGPGILRYIDWQNGLITARDHANAIFIEAPICHPSTMIRREALDRVGGYRAGPFAEDYDLWLRLIAAGYTITKIPQVLFRWRIHPSMTTLTNDPRLSPESHRRLRAEHLAKKLGGATSFAIWGAGPAGRRLARELETHNHRATFFIDIDPKKIGRTRRGAPILSAEDGTARARTERTFLIVAVAALGARDLVRAYLDEHGFAEGEEYLCAI